MRGNCFDASALIKRYVEEEGSDIVRKYWAREVIKFTTSLCFYETLSALKVNFFYRKKLNQDDYKKANLDLCSWYATTLKEHPEPQFLSPNVFFDAQKMADKYQFDLSDAFQIVSVREGFNARMWWGDSRRILVTADTKLAKAARAESLLVWRSLRNRPPLTVDSKACQLTAAISCFG
jgi:predicted nucleic acid-binding protein